MNKTLKIAIYKLEELYVIIYTTGNTVPLMFRKGKTGLCLNFYLIVTIYNATALVSLITENLFSYS